MELKQRRIRLIRERHRKLILESRPRIEYALLEDFEEEPLFDDDELARRFAEPAASETEEAE